MGNDITFSGFQGLQTTWDFWPWKRGSPPNFMKLLQKNRNSRAQSAFCFFVVTLDHQSEKDHRPWWLKLITVHQCHVCVKGKIFLIIMVLSFIVILLLTASLIQSFSYFGKLFLLIMQKNNPLISICEAGCHFDGSRYGKNDENGGYIGPLTEKSK